MNGFLRYPNRYKLILMALTLMLALIQGSATHPAQANNTTMNMAAIPLMFMEQQPNRYQVQMNGQSMWFTQDSFWLLANGQNVKLTFENVNPQARLEPIDRLETHISKFIGNDPAKWQTNIPVYGGVRYHDLYPNTDLIISSKHGKLAWQWEPPAKMGSSQAGQTQDLRLPRKIGVIVDNGTASKTHTLDPNQSLTDQLATIITPQTVNANTNAVIPRQQGAADLVWSTFLGGIYDDFLGSMTIDGSGNIYLTGSTQCTDFPTTAGAYDTTLSGNYDIFVAKLNNSGTSLIYVTFLGGSGEEYGDDIAIDNTGNVYLTGMTNSTNFPTTTGAYDTNFNGGSGGGGDIFITKLNSNGTALIYSTFLGGSGWDRGYAIAIDSANNAYVTGYSMSTNFPVTVGIFDTSYNGAYDVFVAKLNNDGAALSYSTFLGGITTDIGRDITVDSAGNAYMTGETQSTNFPITGGAYDTNHNGSSDVFITKLNSNGTALIYSTFLGGSSDDYGYAISIDGSENAYLTGRTQSTDFPTTIGSYDTSYNGVSYDVFVTKLNSNGTALSYTTFLGGTGNDQGFAIAIDSTSNAYLTGYTDSTDFPITVGAYDTNYNGSGDVFVVKLNSNSTGLTYSTFLGGTSTDLVEAIAINNTGNVYIAGTTNSTDFPTTVGAYDTSFNGTNTYNDILISKLSLGSVSVATNTPIPPTSTDTPIPPTATNTPGPTPTNTSMPPTATNTSGPTPTNTTLPIPTNTPGPTPTNIHGTTPTLTPTPVPILQVNPTSLTFNATQGGSNPANQLFAISNGSSSTLNWMVSESIPWLSVDSLSGTNGKTVNVSIAITGLISGTYNGQITVSATGATNSPQLINITLNVAPPNSTPTNTPTNTATLMPTITQTPTSTPVSAVPILQVTPISLTFEAVLGSTNPNSQSFNISNGGSGTLNWMVSENKSWLSVDTLNGTNSDVINVFIDTNGLTTGTYNGQITVSAIGATNSPQIVNVTLNIVAPTPTPPPTHTPTPTDTATFTPTPTDTATFTPTPTDTATFTPTPTDTATFTPTPTDTATPTDTPTKTPTVTPITTKMTYLPMLIKSETPPTPTPTFTPTPTPTPTPPSTPAPAHLYIKSKNTGGINPVEVRNANGGALLLSCVIPAEPDKNTQIETFCGDFAPTQSYNVIYITKTCGKLILGPFEDAAQGGRITRYVFCN